MNLTEFFEKILGAFTVTSFSLGDVPGRRVVAENWVGTAQNITEVEPEAEPEVQTKKRSELTEDEKAFIREHYTEKGITWVAKEIHRAKRTVSDFAELEGLVPHQKHYLYTDAELLEMAYAVKILTGDYPTEDVGWSRRFEKAAVRVGMPGPRRYRKRFGSLKNAWNLAEQQVNAEE